MNKKTVVLLFSMFTCQAGIAINQADFLKNELHTTYKTTWCTMADAERFAIEGQNGLIDGVEVNKKLFSILESLHPVNAKDIAQTAAILLCANSLFVPYNTEASLMCTRKMFELAESSNFRLAVLLLKSQSVDGVSYIFPTKPSIASYKILEKAINMLKSEHNGHTKEACTELEKLKENSNETIKAILSMFAL